MFVCVNFFYPDILFVCEYRGSETTKQKVKIKQSRAAPNDLETIPGQAPLKPASQHLLASPYY